MLDTDTKRRIDTARDIFVVEVSDSWELELRSGWGVEAVRARQLRQIDF